MRRRELVNKNASFISVNHRREKNRAQHLDAQRSHKNAVLSSWP